MNSAAMLTTMQSSFSLFVTTRLEDIRRFHKEIMELEVPVNEEEISLETDSTRQSLVVKHMDENTMENLYWIPFAYFDDVEGYIAAHLAVPSTTQPN